MLVGLYNNRQGWPDGFTFWFYQFSTFPCSVSDLSGHQSYIEQKFFRTRTKGLITIVILFFRYEASICTKILSTFTKIQKTLKAQLKTDLDQWKTSKQFKYVGKHCHIHRYLLSRLLWRFTPYNDLSFFFCWHRLSLCNRFKN